MYFITIKRMLEVCFSAHPNIQYRALCLNAFMCAVERVPLLFFCLGTVSALRKQKDTDQGADKQHARIEQKRHNLEGGQFIAQLMDRR